MLEKYKKDRGLHNVAQIVGGHSLQIILGTWDCVAELLTKFVKSFGPSLKSLGHQVTDPQTPRARVPGVSQSPRCWWMNGARAWRSMRTLKPCRCRQDTAMSPAFGPRDMEDEDFEALPAAVAWTIRFGKT